jgi:hypothetical protein
MTEVADHAVFRLGSGHRKASRCPELFLRGYFPAFTFPQRAWVHRVQ